MQKTHAGIAVVGLYAAVATLTRILRPTAWKAKFIPLQCAGVPSLSHAESAIATNMMADRLIPLTPPLLPPMDQTTERLVDFALSRRFATLPEGVIHECKRHVIDSFACVVDGFADPVCAAARAVAGRYEGSPVATIWGTGAPSTPEACAFANGVMLRFTDLSDTYVGQSRGHPSDMLSAIIATAEAKGASGAETLKAMALAYDVYCSFIDAIDINNRGWDQPVYGVLGAALGVGRLLHLSRQQLGEAVALALTPNMALAQARLGELSNWKACAGANASRNGLFAAMLAQRGITGPPAVFEGKGGLWDVVGPFAWPLPDHGMPYLLARTDIKRLPLCYHGQSAVQAALAIRDRVDVSRIAEITVATYRTAVAMMGTDASRWAPATRETADHSIPYVIAVALLDGELTRRSFADDRLRDPALAAIMHKVIVVEDADLHAQYPQAAPSRVSIRLVDGTTVAHEVRFPKGHEGDPMTDAEIDAKFLAAFANYGPLGDAGSALAALWRFDAAVDMRRDVLRHLDRRLPADTSTEA